MGNELELELSRIKTTNCPVLNKRGGSPVLVRGATTSMRGAGRHSYYSHLACEHSRRRKKEAHLMQSWKLMEVDFISTAVRT